MCLVAVNSPLTYYIHYANHLIAELPLQAAACLAFSRAGLYRSLVPRLSAKAVLLGRLISWH